VGNPTFNKNEWGLIGVAGHIYSTNVFGDLNVIGRIGGDWIYKYCENFKLQNQVTTGFTKSFVNGYFTTLNIQNSADVYFKSRIIISFAHTYNYNKGLENDIYYLHSTITNSLTYMVSPHTRIRFNQFYKLITHSNQSNWGVFLQFVTGYGKRN
jgi:hypothetical protein